jgi:glycosyltransferase involved in cell wall biosynthesis
VTAVHSYEDCSLWSFQEARKLGKACIYDMPIGYYPAWQDTQHTLLKKFSDWVGEGSHRSAPYTRPEQKIKEMEIADLVLAPSTFVARTIIPFVEKRVEIAKYGVDSNRWNPRTGDRKPGPLRFVFAGQLSVRKGIPLLLNAWRAAAMKDATLTLIGAWNLAHKAARSLPPGVTHIGPLSSSELLRQYHLADVFVFPSYFEGWGLVLTEAMACGLPLLTTEATGAPDFADGSCARIVPTGDVDRLVDELRWYSSNRDQIQPMGRAARAKAETLTWDSYRIQVARAVAPYC